MKYWYFAEGKVAGPTEGSQLKQLAGFDSATLVCPENRSGTNAEDWKPASEFPELQSKAATPVAVATQTPIETPSSGWQTALSDLQKDLRMIRERLEDISRGQKADISQLQSQFSGTIKDLQMVMERQAAEIAKIKEAPPPIPATKPGYPQSGSVQEVQNLGDKILPPLAAPVVLEPPMPKAEPVKKEEPKPAAKPPEKTEVFDRWAEPPKKEEEPPKREEKTRTYAPIPEGLLKSTPKAGAKSKPLAKNKKAMAAAAVIAAAGIAVAVYFSMSKTPDKKMASEPAPAASGSSQPQDAFSDIIQELPPPDSFSNGELMELDGSKAAGGPDSEINLFEPPAEEIKKKEVKKAPAKKKPAAPKAKASEPISAENMVITPAETPKPETTTTTEEAVKTESAPPAETVTKTEEPKKTEDVKKPAANLPGVDITTPSDEEIWPETP